MTGDAPPRVLELTRVAAEHLAGRGVEDPRLDSELLLAHILGLRRLDLYLQFDRPLEPHEVTAYREAIRRRSRREPLQYITGESVFRELTLRVDPRVLIPRPETEVLVEEVLRWARATDPPGDDLSALDVGTGSGAIALSLLREGPFRTVVATDVSAGALEVARANAEAARLADRLDLRLGPLWEPVGGGERFDVIVSNPPYVGESERDGLMPEVRDHEPPEALFSGPDGMDVIREIVDGAPARLHAGGVLALEVGEGQASAVADLLRTRRFGEIRIVKDLAGRDRIVLAASES